MAHIDRNVAWVTALESLWALGMAFIAFDLVAALLYSVGGSATLVAIATVAATLLVYLPQIFAPYLQQRVRHLIGGAALGHILIVLPYAILVVALGVTESKPLLRNITVVSIALAAAGNSFAAPIYQQVRLHMFPRKSRSASYSTTIFGGMVAGTVGAALAIPLLHLNGGPTQQNYFWSFLVAVVIGGLAIGCFAMMRDPHPIAPASTAVRPMAEYLREYRDIFRKNRNLRIFLLSEWAHWMSALGGTFITFYAIGLYGEGIAPEMSFTRSLAAILTVPIGHWMMTRFGARALIVAFYVLAIVMYLTITLFNARWVLWSSGFLMGVTMILRVNYMFHFIAALTRETDKSKHFALCSAVVGPVTVLGPFVGACLYKLLGNYQALFGIAIIPLCFGLYLVTRKLRDPAREIEVPALAAVPLKSTP